MSLSLKFKSLKFFYTNMVNFSESRQRPRKAPGLKECILLSSFRCNDVDYLLIKFEPTGELNFEE